MKVLFRKESTEGFSKEQMQNVLTDENDLAEVKVTGENEEDIVD